MSVIPIKDGRLFYCGRQIGPDEALVRVGNVLWALVDRDMLAELSLYQWSPKIAGRRTRIIYPRRHLEGNTFILMHNHIMAGKVGPGQVPDHINGDTLDNRRCNLRVVTAAQNNNNRSANRGSTSRYKGVHLKRKCLRPSWTAQLTCKGRHYYLGSFGTEEEAARAYDEAAREHHGVFGRYNFPRPGERSAVLVVEEGPGDAA